MIDIIPVPADHVQEAWELSAPMLERALERGSDEYSLEDLRLNCISGRWQLWLCAKDGNILSVSLTSLQRFPQTRIIYMHAFAGSMDAELCKEAWRVLLEHAKSHGCSRVQFFGRPGWSRSGVLPEGWRKTHEIITVPVV